MIVVIEAWVQREAGMDIYACAAALRWAEDPPLRPKEAFRHLMWTHMESTFGK